MKRLLLSLIAALALPTAASADSVWLVLKDTASGANARAAFEKIEMKSMAQCNEEAQKLWSRWNWDDYV